MEYVIYCRKSTDETSEKQNQSIPDQIRYCMQYLRDHNLKIMGKPKDFSDFENKHELEREDNDTDLTNRKIYKETRHLFIVKEQETAKIPGKRKKRRKLMQMIYHGKIKGLISYSPDRQARNILEGGELINFVDEGKVDLKYTNFHFENTAAGKMMLGVWFVFSKQYSDNISENVHRGIGSAVDKGKALGYYKYGYFRNDENYYQPDGERFSLMKEAFYLKIHKKKSDEYIAARLNARGRRRTIGTRSLPVNPKNLYKIWRDPFYYGVHVVGDRVSDQIISNPYYEPMISEQEYNILAKQREAHKSLLTPKQIKAEYEDITPVSKGMLKTTDGCSLTFNLPNKARYYKKLALIQKKHPGATLKNVVKSNQIRYKVANRKSKLSGIEITGSELDESIVQQLKKIELKVDSKTYERYVTDMKRNMHVVQQNLAEERSILTLRINSVRKEQSEYVRKHMGIKKDKIEESVYEKKKKEYEETIDRLEEDMSLLGKSERNTIAEFEMFLHYLTNASSLYRKGSFVQKRQICEIFFSNIILDNKKRLTIEVKPIFMDLFVLNGAEYEGRTRNLVLGKDAL